MHRALFTLLLFAWLAPAAEYDLLVRNARVVDGSGNPWFRGSVAVKAGHIAAVGALPDATAGVVIDAKGRVIAPGFIDSHAYRKQHRAEPASGELSARRCDYGSHGKLREFDAESAGLVRQTKQPGDRDQCSVAGRPQ
jgi:predicted amidohydrolase